MRDVHVHFLHGNPVGYNIEFFEGFIKVAQDAGLDEIYMLEHTHQFTAFLMRTNKVMLVQIFWNLQICWYNDKKLAKL